MRRSLGHLLRCHIGLLVCINAGTGIKVRFFFRVQRLWASDSARTRLLLGQDYIDVDRHRRVIVTLWCLLSIYGCYSDYMFKAQNIHDGPGIFRTRPHA
jgi:hypothetical protein